MSLSLQPPELLDEITSHIALPSDLLSLALTSKTLHAIVIPKQLEFREVCCELRRLSLWKALAEHPGLTCRILSLKVQNGSFVPYSRTPVVVPRSLNPSGEEPLLVECHPADASANKCEVGCSDALCAAIQEMPSLVRFCFSQTQSICTHPITPIFRAVLQSCPNLRELEIHSADGSLYFESIAAPVSLSRFLLSAQATDFCGQTSSGNSRI